MKEEGEETAAVVRSASFTPGPWVIWPHPNPGFGFGVRRSGCDECRPIFHDGATAADAALIAAAPDLLLALATAMRALRSYQYGNDATDLAEDVANHAAKIIAKARAPHNDGAVPTNTEQEE